MASNTATLGDFGWSVLSGALFRPFVTRRLQLAMLRESMPAPFYAVTGEPNPVANRPSQVPMAPEALGGPPPGGAPGQQASQPTIINLNRIESRIVPLPLPGKDFAGLAPGGPGVLYVLVHEWPDAPGSGSTPTQTLYQYALSAPKQLTKWIEDVDEFAVSADRSRILYRRGSDWALVSAEQAPEPDAGRIDLGPLQIEVDPPAEWRQMYAEAWRLMQDFFYDPDHHGQDLAAQERHYATYLPNLTRRRDLNVLLGKALGHVSVSHLSVGGGDIPTPPGTQSRIGMLGADYVVNEGQYQISRIFNSGHFNSVHPLAQAPLDQPGVFVAPGDYLLMVNGEPVETSRNLHSYFEGTALTPTRITVSQVPNGSQARTYTVVPLPGENTLRRIHWAEINRQVVERESEGILGYIYIPNFSPRGLETTFRQLLESADRRGLIIDQRFAPGGITADWLIEWLSRSPLYYYAFRHGDHIPVPTNPLPEAKVLLINHVNASAAETFALMFNLDNVGRSIGTRTAGAGIGPYAPIPPLLDGGRISIPNRAAFDPAGSWGIENIGVEPDIEVEWLPIDWRANRDPQLQAAIRTVLQAIVDNPPLEVTRPDYPVHGGGR